jgi:hypothetical protein
MEEIISNVCGFLAIIAMKRKSTSLFSSQFENIIQHFTSYMIWNLEGCTFLASSISMELRFQARLYVYLLHNNTKVFFADCWKVHHFVLVTNVGLLVTMI